jgi:hypothetical protein
VIPFSICNSSFFLTFPPLTYTLVSSVLILSSSHFLFWFAYYSHCGPGSSVGIANDYGLDGPGIDARWGRDFPHLSRPALGPTQLLYNGYRVFPGDRKRPGRDAEPSPFQCRGQNQSRSIHLLSLRAFVACEKGETYLPITRIALGRLIPLKISTRILLGVKTAECKVDNLLPKVPMSRNLEALTSQNPLGPTGL